MPALRAYEPELQELLDTAVDAHRVPGAVIGIARGDERLVVGAGLANVGTGVSVTPDTLFQIGSISKIYTASLVMQLVHAGLVDLDEPVRSPLQEFRLRDDAATLAITPRQLLSHTSGIEGDHFLDCGRNPDAMWRYVSTLEDVGQVHEPEDLFSYCNAGYGVLGRLIEESTGDHFVRALQRRLLRPLSARHTVAQAEQALVHRVAAGHRLVDGDHEVAPWLLSVFNTAAGGIVANADDLLDFALLHTNGGATADGKQVIPPGAVSDMAEPQIDVPGTADEWGLGWQISRWGDVQVLGHGGDTVFQRAQLVSVPDADAAIVVLTNAGHGVACILDALAEIGPAVLGVAPPAPPSVDPDHEADASWSAAGTYERMHQRLTIARGEADTLEMTITPDDTFAATGQSERTMRLDPIDADRFLTQDPHGAVPAVVTLIRDGDEPPAFVHYGLRAHARIS